MIVGPVKTHRITPATKSLITLLDTYIKDFQDKSVLVITSKIVSLCEGSVVSIKDTNKEKLIREQSDLYLKNGNSKYGIRFTITNNTLIPTAGIDESNASDVYVLWPKDAQQTANQVREYLCNRFKIRYAGVVISDSTCSPLRLGTSGISLAHSGFKATNDYVGKKDLFDKPFKVSRANIAGGLAASAVLTMGEGTEQTPLCVIKDVPFVTFQPRNPTAAELKMTNISPEDDLFAPFLQAVTWHSELDGSEQKPNMRHNNNKR